ncbi:MAG: GGDEF domain-containing protein [Sulfurimonas sp.]|nr:GGDEF domain-containing protein [Sulfurimonas sp.]
MAGTLRSRNRRNINDVNPPAKSSGSSILNMDEPSSDLEIYSKEVLSVLISDNLPPTPNNFSLYFDRLLEDKSESLRKQILSILELEENNDDESTIMLEHSLKQGFSSVKNILGVTANLYKNMSLMTKILDKRKQELSEISDSKSTISIIASLDGDINKLNSILKKQNSQMKILYDETATIVKNVENETIFDNKFGVYNKRYLMSKIEQEMELINEFNHKSSLIMIELSRELIDSINNEKAITLMIRTIARLLLKTSRRSDIVAHYGNGIFAMLLKHTDIDSAKKASERLCDLVANSNFFLADREVRLKISIGITDIDTLYSVEEIVVSAMNGVEKAYSKKNIDFAVSLREQAVVGERR